MRRTQLLIVGAGPYGLATAAYARDQGVETILAGMPMEFWRQNMPSGMYLRSPLDWQIDPLNRCTLTAFLKRKGLTEEHASPLPLDLFCDYGRWFQEEYDLRAESALVVELRQAGAIFEARTADGELIEARNVLLAPGFSPFVNLPPELTAMIPEGRFSHTCDTVDFDFLRSQRCLIIGGRQSAYEWAVLMAERGVAQVHVSHRHEAPRFEDSDWSWVREMIDGTARVPGWFRRLTDGERQAIRQRFYAEGRLKLEPWLAPRLGNPRIRVWPGTNVVACEPDAAGALALRLDDGTSLTVDHVLFATGYRVDLARLPLLADESIRDRLLLADGYTALDESFQSSVPGLFFAGLPTTVDFGPFFGFVAGCPVTARLIVEAVSQGAATGSPRELH